MLTEQDYKEAAGIIGCSVAAIKAVSGVESGGSGFLKSGKIKLKFEGHVFHKLTKGRFAAQHPTLSYPAWTEKYSRFGEDSYIRFNQAYALDPVAAMEATSWGMFQVMGFNYASCGFNSVKELGLYLKEGESYQLKAFCMYIKSQGLAVYLQKQQWASFAYRYNGADYKKHHYDLQLQAEFEKFNP
ncbi:N-acetylmuramidase family protein [Mucilaginibacter sp. P25]|uniref:N-acetylmuramidase family protein n=1 Tax=Mucilaginibacter sp. P25 TaxID=3423945 RepID=UPI003D7B7FC7